MAPNCKNIPGKSFLRLCNSCVYSLIGGHSGRKNEAESSIFLDKRLNTITVSSKFLFVFQPPDCGHGITSHFTWKKGINLIYYYCSSFEFFELEDYYHTANVLIVNYKCFMWNKSTGEKFCSFYIIFFCKIYTNVWFYIFLNAESRANYM